MSIVLVMQSQLRTNDGVGYVEDLPSIDVSACQESALYLFTEYSVTFEGQSAEDGRYLGIAVLAPHVQAGRLPSALTEAHGASGCAPERTG